MTDAKKLTVIGYCIDIHRAAVEDDSGDRHLADSGYLLEAIDAVLADDLGHPVLRMFTGGQHG